MKGQARIAPPEQGGDVRDLWKIVAQLCSRENRQWEVKLAAEAPGSATFNGSDEKVILDLSELGTEEFILCQDGVAKRFNVVAAFIADVVDP